MLSRLRAAAPAGKAHLLPALGILNCHAAPADAKSRICGLLARMVLPRAMERTAGTLLQQLLLACRRAGWICVRRV